MADEVKDILAKAKIQSLEQIAENLNIQQKGFGAVSGIPKYHITADSNVRELIRDVIREINYDDKYGSVDVSPRQKIYWALNGHGLNSPEEIKKEFTNFVDAAKKKLLPSSKLEYSSSTPNN